MNILEISNVSKSYNGHKALSDISLNIPEGSVYGLLGPNGAGKTTLLRIINHITAPDSGTVTFNGHTLNADDVNDIGYLPEERGLYKKMKVGEQALFFARLKGLSKAEATRRLQEWFSRFGITDWWGKKVEELSKGMAQKVQFIVTVLHQPRLLIFDEPFSGFDPINANLLKEEILRLRDAGSTVIFSTHNMESVEKVCDHITLINRSHNILTGSVADIRNEAGKGRLSISFRGPDNGLVQALTPLAEQDSMHRFETSCPDVTRLRLKMQPGIKISQIIDTANRLVEIESFNRDLPSMDEIFIDAVNRNNLPEIPSLEIQSTRSTSI
ncbi:MAG: ATP-binding cassette domain-containing protein [Muribaculaceae bacterium]|jgi:ABC-type uncharacterized transport system, ATPase component|nr:ATP-binding cassette domain-containing protein [Muribaculaceae bacterium]